MVPRRQQPVQLAAIERRQLDALLPGQVEDGVQPQGAIEVAVQVGLGKALQQVERDLAAHRSTIRPGARRLQHRPFTMRSAIVTYVLLATSAPMAAASPERGETTERISYNQNARPQQATPPDPATSRGWVELASPTPASHGREFIEVGADAGTFSQLRIAAASGRPEIHAVRIEYEDGSRRVFRVDRVVDKRRGPATLDLRGARQIKQIVVSTDRASSGSYVLEATTAQTSVAASP